MEISARSRPDYERVEDDGRLTMKAALQDIAPTLHAMAVHDAVSPEESIDYLNTAMQYYDSDFDRARALRDRGKHQYFANKANWENDFEESLNKLHAYRRSQSTRPAYRCPFREIAATQAMRGRVLLHFALQEGSAKHFGAAHQKLHEAQMYLADEHFKPDQYDINFAAIDALASRLSADVRMDSPTRRLGHAALIAPLSETIFADHAGRWHVEAPAKAITRVGAAALAGLVPSYARKPGTIANKLALRVVGL